MEINTKMWTLCRALFCGTEGVEFGVQGYPEAGEGALRACARGESRTPEIGIRVAPLRCRWGLVERHSPAGEGAGECPVGTFRSRDPSPSPSLA